MSSVVYKYSLVAPVSEVTMPRGSIVRLVAVDPGGGHPAIWAEHEIGAAKEVRTFLVAGTGMFIEPGLVHLGSMVDGQYIWHVYERRQEDAVGQPPLTQASQAFWEAATNEHERKHAERNGSTTPDGTY